ncbi:BrnT family toxin [Candidatus Saccharibacteria bacterium]|nr:BrnT family toxin [Candidatus Saccharibacteria bacterium]
MDGQVIEWDDSKNELNVQKHGISFRLAMRVFYDKNRIEYHDSAHSGQEDRYIVLGLVQDILFVVYTERGDNIRLISARPATKAEKDIYYGNY